MVSCGKMELEVNCPDCDGPVEQLATDRRKNVVQPVGARYAYCGHCERFWLVKVVFAEGVFD